MSTTLEVAAVVLAALDRDRLRGRFLERPVAGERLGRLVVSGWVAPAACEIETIEVADETAVIARAAPEPATRGDGRCSFRAEVADGVLREPAVLLVRAVLQDGTQTPFGEVRLAPAESLDASPAARPGILARLRGVVAAR